MQATNSRDSVLESFRLAPPARPGAYLGKVWHSKRRFSWGIRWDSTAHDLEHGGRWEPVEELN